MLKKLIILSAICVLTFMLTHNVKAKVRTWDYSDPFTISAETVPVFSSPDIQSSESFFMTKGMTVNPLETIIINGYRWFKINSRYWLPAIEPMGVVNVEQSEKKSHIEDIYGIFDQPHRYAVKMVKYPEAKGRMETYKKIGDKYVMQHTYTLSYRKEGQKTKYGDLKSPGGNVVRYLYRTTRSGMNGWDSTGQHFGVYKVSFPMPHDALPHLIEGRITDYQYNKIPAINWKGEGENRMLYPHPASYMGADIVLHTKRKGSRGCINIPNEAMSFFYHEDVVTENDKEIIPLVIYDEDVVAPPIGQLI